MIELKKNGKTSKTTATENNFQRELFKVNSEITKVTLRRSVLCSSYLFQANFLLFSSVFTLSPQ